MKEIFEGFWYEHYQTKEWLIQPNYHSGKGQKCPECCSEKKEFRNELTNLGFFTSVILVIIVANLLLKIIF